MREHEAKEQHRPRPELQHKKEITMRNALNATDFIQQETPGTAAIISLGTLHGVTIFFTNEGKSGMNFPVGDETGTRRPELHIGKDFDLDTLFRKVCLIRGRYDLERALDGQAPFDWGIAGTWRDVFPVMEKIRCIAGGAA